MMIREITSAVVIDYYFDLDYPMLNRLNKRDVDSSRSATFSLVDKRKDEVADEGFVVLLGLKDDNHLRKSISFVRPKITNEQMNICNISSTLLQYLERLF